MSDENSEPADDHRVETEDTASGDLPVKPWDPKEIRITTKTFTLREIFTQITDGDLDLAPDFQRSFVWKDRQQIRLIESILLGIPLPAFYFNQDAMGAHQVIDGVQRLTTLKHFMSDQLILAEEALEYLGPLRGSSFSTLDPATRRRLSGTQIVAHVIEPQTPDEVKYDIFNRVNTGGSPLTAQEIRHCMSKTTSRELLKNMVQTEEFAQATARVFWSKDDADNDVRDNKRMADREMALRFCAFKSTSTAEYARASSLDAFLLEFTRRLDRGDGLDLDVLSVQFTQAMTNCHHVLGRAAFRRWPTGGGRRGPLNRAIFESQALALADYPLPTIMPHAEAICASFRALFTNSIYDASVRSGTGDPRRVERRLQMTKDALRSLLPC